MCVHVPRQEPEELIESLGVFLYYSPTSFFLLFCICVCAQMCIYIYIQLLKRPKEDVRSPRVTGGCEPLDIDVGK